MPLALASMAAAGPNVPRDEYVYPSNSDDSDFEDSFRTIRDDTSEVFDPPPAVPSDLESETESIVPNENDENEDEPNTYGLQQTPIYNFRHDGEDLEDFQDGWYWAYLPNEQDTEPEIGPFTGKQQLLLDPREQEPEFFFNEMFSPSMFDTIAEATNRYAAQKLQQRGKFYYLLFFILSKRSA